MIPKSKFQFKTHRAVAANFASTQPDKLSDEYQSWEEARDAVADEFSKDNRNFNHDRFIAMCGGIIPIRIPTEVRDDVKTDLSAALIASGRSADSINLSLANLINKPREIK